VLTLSRFTPIAFAAVSVALAQNPPVDSSAAQVYEAKATAVTGQVSRLRDERPWALSRGERVPIQQVITTGGDGFAHFEVAGGSGFDVFGNSRVVFRQNAASAGDLVDVLAGRAKIHFQPTLDQPQQRVYCPVAIISAHEPATVALTVDEDDRVRIDVLEGEVRVQHTLLPRNEPLLVKAVDAILVQRDQPISRQVDRGSLYRYTVKILSAITFGHSSNHNADPIEQNKFLAEAKPVTLELGLGR
jgi:ferric-dicitrate binding protein FerR (iron transport regulator)